MGLLFIVLGLLGEGIAIGLWLVGESSIWTLTTVHLSAMALLGYGLYRVPIRTERARHLRPALLYGFILSLFIPVWGVLAGIVMAIVVALFALRIRTDVYDEYEEYIYSRTEFSSDIIEQDLSRIRSEAYLDPYADILHRKGKDPRKAMVINRLSREASSTGILLLQQAVHDPDVEVQQFAANGLLRIEDRIHEEIRVAEEAVQQIGHASEYMRLAELYSHFADLGLSDESLSRHYLTESANAYYSVLELDLDKVEVYERLIDILLRLERYEDAHEMLRAAREREIESPTLIFLRCRWDYSMGYFERLRKRVQQLDPSEFSQSEREVLAFWGVA